MDHICKAQSIVPGNSVTSLNAVVNNDIVRKTFALICQYLWNIYWVEGS